MSRSAARTNSNVEPRRWATERRRFSHPRAVYPTLVTLRRLSIGINSADSCEIMSHHAVSPVVTGPQGTLRNPAWGVVQLLLGGQGPGDQRFQLLACMGGMVEHQGLEALQEPDQRCPRIVGDGKVAGDAADLAQQRLGTD